MKMLYSLYSFFRRAHSAIPYALGQDWAFPPLRVTLEITYRCNLRCEMCYLIRQEEIRAESGNRDKSLELTTAEVKKLIGQLPRFSFLTFTGGEPLLRPDILELLSAAAAHNQVALITNGFLLDRPMAEALIKIKPRAVAVSIDGLERMHDQIRAVPGSFQKAKEALHYLKEARSQKRRKFPLLEMKTVITAVNVGQLADIYRLAEEIGVDSLTLQMLSTSVNMNGLFLSKLPTMMQKPAAISDFPVETLRQQLAACQAIAARSKVGLRIIPPVPETEIIKHYRNETALADYFCRWPWSTARINPYGDVYPCFNFPVGNIREQSFGRIWNGEPYRTFRRGLRQKKIFPGCAGCCMLEYQGRVPAGS